MPRPNEPVERSPSRVPEPPPETKEGAEQDLPGHVDDPDSEPDELPDGGGPSREAPSEDDY